MDIQEKLDLLKKKRKHMASAYSADRITGKQYQLITDNIDLLVGQALLFDKHAHRLLKEIKNIGV